jgi:hypothetical protein
MTGKRLAPLDLPSVARRHLRRRSPGAAAGGPSFGDLSRTTVHLDERFCRRVAAHYDRAPALRYGPALRRRYDALKAQNLAQYESVVAAGIEVEPWSGHDRPYRDSRQLRQSVRATRRLRVHLTSGAHGPGPPTGFHPMREPAGVTAQGVELCHNDVFRVVHDIFGHVMFGHGFGPRGEFLASYCQMTMYPAEVHPVLFTEQIGQICWFYYGPHLLDASGTLPGPGDSGYVPPARRPYPEQKVFAYPDHFLGTFRSMFRHEDRHGDRHEDREEP